MAVNGNGGRTTVRGETCSLWFLRMEELSSAEGLVRDIINSEGTKTKTNKKIGPVFPLCSGIATTRATAENNA